MLEFFVCVESVQLLNGTYILSVDLILTKSNYCSKYNFHFVFPKDNAFGRCEQYDGRKGSFSSEYVYQLDRKTLQLLEKELDRLSEQGYTWTDTYSQCILKTILNDRPRIVYDPSSCDQQHTPSTVTGEAELIPSPLPTTKHTESRHDNENIQVSVFLGLNAKLRNNLNRKEKSSFIRNATAHASN